MSYKTLLLSILLLSIIHNLQAQNKHKDNGYLIYTLGRDTTMIGHYILKGNDFNMVIVVMSNLNVHKVKGNLFPNGELKSAEGYIYKPGVAKDSLLLQSYKLITKNDSTFIQQKTAQNTAVYRYAGKGILHLGINPYIFYLPLLPNYVPKNTGDSIISSQHVLDNGVPFIVKRINKTTLTARSRLLGSFTLYLNEKGKLKAIDGVGTTWNVKGTLVPYLNMDSVIHANSEREQQYGAIPDLNKPDSVQATIASMIIKINYNRPSMRSRIIFGEVVPWNRFWRTGANAATRISLNAPVLFNNKELPAGEYSIFTMPTQSGWTMMFNKEANIWGTRYNPANDVLKVPMQVEQLKEPVELMTIEIVPVNDGGAINVIWEKTKASVKFTTKK